MEMGVIQDSLIGRFQGFDSPVGGLKPVVYADWTASGRGLHVRNIFIFFSFVCLRGLLLPDLNHVAW